MPPKPPSHAPREPGKAALQNQRVLVTRAAHQAGELVALLEAEGANPLALPVVRIADPPDWSPVDRALAELARYDWIVFSSSNGVRAVVDRLGTMTMPGDHAGLGGVRVAAVGPGTAMTLEKAGVAVALMPPRDFRAEGLLAALIPIASGRRFLLVRASRGRDTLALGLRAAGATVEEIVVYSSVDVSPGDAEVAPIARQLRAGQIDWVTLTSSAIAQATVRILGDDLHRTKLASLSPITSQTLLELGLAVTVEARCHTLPGLVAAMREWP